MGDKFFEDQAKGAPSKSKTPDKDSKAAKRSSTNKTSKSGTKSITKTPVKAPSSEEPKQVDIIWTVAFVVVAFVIGFFIRGIIMPPTVATVPPTNNTSSLAPGTSSNSDAPPLSEGQLQGDNLPQGHPNIGDESTQSGGAPAASPPSSEMGHGESDVPASGPLQEGGQSVDVKESDTNK